MPSKYGFKTRQEQWEEEKQREQQRREAARAEEEKRLRELRELLDKYYKPHLPKIIDIVKDFLQARNYEIGNVEVAESGFIEIYVMSPTIKIKIQPKMSSRTLYLELTAVYGGGGNKRPVSSEELKGSGIYDLANVISGHIHLFVEPHVEIYESDEWREYDTGPHPGEWM